MDTEQLVEVADICRGCMAKRPKDRPDSASVALRLWSVLTPQLTPQPLLLGRAELS